MLNINVFYRCNFDITLNNIESLTIILLCLCNASEFVLYILILSWNLYRQGNKRRKNYPVQSLVMSCQKNFQTALCVGLQLARHYAFEIVELMPRAWNFETLKLFLWPACGQGWIWCEFIDCKKPQR